MEVQGEEEGTCGDDEAEEREGSEDGQVTEMGNAGRGAGKRLFPVLKEERLRRLGL
jgi:hypothetical protein